MAEPETIEQRWKRLSAEIGKTYTADVLIYSGKIEDGTVDSLIAIARRKDRRENVVLLLASRGGSPDAAFRMARCLKRYYKNFIIFIYGRCKSAGTMIAIGADEIIISDFGEFGPLDVQLDKQDELFENVSGLNIMQALISLDTRTIEFFKEALIDLRTGSKGQISTKLASDIATKLAIGAYDKIYHQIEPVQLGAIERAINIASDYAKRLKSKNVKPDAIDRLVNRYPSHSFVIDLEEAKELFNIVRTPNELEEQLCECIAHVLRDQAETSFTLKLNELEHSNEGISENVEQSPTGTQTGGAADNASATEQAEPAKSRPRAVT